MDCIGRHVEKGDNAQYTVRWYSYTPVDVAVELPAISRAFRYMVLAQGTVTRREATGKMKGNTSAMTLNQDTVVYTYVNNSCSCAISVCNDIRLNRLNAE